MFQFQCREAILAPFLQETTGSFKVCCLSCFHYYIATVTDEGKVFSRFPLLFIEPGKLWQYLCLEDFNILIFIFQISVVTLKEFPSFLLCLSPLTSGIYQKAIHT